MPRKKTIAILIVCFAMWILAMVYFFQGDDGTHFEDLYFRPLMSAFKIPHVTKTYFRSGGIPKFLLIAQDNITNTFWQQQLLHITQQQCPLQCQFIANKYEAGSVDAIVFYLRHLKDKETMVSGLPKRDSTQPWIVLSFEAAILANSKYNSNYSAFNGVFNRTMMHRTDADIFTPHGFIVNNKDIPFLPDGWALTPPNASSIANQPDKRSLAVSFISNCQAKSGRLEYITEMKRHCQVDVFGRCGEYRCGASRYVGHGYRIETDECFQKAASRYLFYLAFENSICKDYATEKLYNMLYYRIVPVVLGGADYRSILPPNSYINAADFSPKELAAYLLHLRENPQKYDTYMEWRKFNRPSTVGGIRTMCQLCVKLHDKSFYEYNVYHDFYKWFLIDANCDRGWVNSTVGVAQMGQ